MREVHMARVKAFPQSARPGNFILADKHVACVSGVPCVFILKPYPLPFDMLFCLAHIHVSIDIFDLVQDLNNDCLHFKRCHIVMSVCSNLCVISKHDFLVFPFCFRVHVCCSCFQSPFVLSWAEEPQPILISPELSFCSSLSH